MTQAFINRPDFAIFGVRIDDASVAVFASRTLTQVALEACIREDRYFDPGAAFAVSYSDRLEGVDFKGHMRDYVYVVDVDYASALARLITTDLVEPPQRAVGP